MQSDADLRALVNQAGIYANVPLGGVAVTPEAFTTQVCKHDRWSVRDAQMIAAAVNALPSLLDRIAALEAALREMVLHHDVLTNGKLTCAERDMAAALLTEGPK